MTDRNTDTRQPIDPGWTDRRALPVVPFSESVTFFDWLTAHCERAGRLDAEPEDGEREWSVAA